MYAEFWQEIFGLNAEIMFLEDSNYFSVSG